MPEGPATTARFRLHWCEPTGFLIAEILRFFRAVRAELLRGVGYGVILAAIITSAVLLFAPAVVRTEVLKVPALMLVGLIVHVGLFVIAFLPFVLIGRWVELRPGRVTVNGAKFKSERVLGVRIEAAGDRPVKLIVRVAGDRQRPKPRDYAVGVHRRITIAELTSSIQSCLSIDPEVVGTEGAPSLRVARHSGE